MDKNWIMQDKINQSQVKVIQSMGNLIKTLMKDLTALEKKVAELELKQDTSCDFPEVVEVENVMKGEYNG